MRSGGLFRCLHGVEGGLTSRRNCPPCVILSSGDLRRLAGVGPAALRTFNLVDNVNRFGVGGCNSAFVGTVGGCANGWGVER